MLKSSTTRKNVKVTAVSVQTTERQIPLSVRKRTQNTNTVGQRLYEKLNYEKVNQDFYAYSLYL